MSSSWSGQFDHTRVGLEHAQEDWRDDDLAPVRGIVFGVLVGIGFWVIVTLLVVGLITGVL